MNRASAGCPVRNPAHARIHDLITSADNPPSVESAWPPTNQIPVGNASVMVLEGAVIFTTGSNERFRGKFPESMPERPPSPPAISKGPQLVWGPLLMALIPAFVLAIMFCWVAAA